MPDPGRSASAGTGQPDPPEPGPIATPKRRPRRRDNAARDAWIFENCEAYGDAALRDKGKAEHSEWEWDLSDQGINNAIKREAERRGVPRPKRPGTSAESHA
jgi:hypothetical protein